MQVNEEKNYQGERSEQGKTVNVAEAKERPILFSGPMVKAILEGCKTQTRRVVKIPLHGETDSSWVKSIHQDGGGNWIAWSTDAPTVAEFTKKAYPNGEGFHCPYGRVGDRLWVRETFAVMNKDAFELRRPAPYGLRYKADPDTATMLSFRPSIFMPRWASRVTLEITDVRVERLQEISEADAIAEGMQRSENTGMYPSPQGNCDYATWAFKYGWDSINDKRAPWESNPWVWVISFSPDSRH